MQFDKLATTVEEQAALLLSRGLVCEDPERLKLYLGTIGYYRLGAYWPPFENLPKEGVTRSKKFIAGTHLDDILNIYIFDRKLRLLVMEALERIEVNVRSRWTNRMTLEYGSHAHLDIDLFSDTWLYHSRVARLARGVEESKETFHVHYKAKYTSPFLPPLWAVCETMTFGELSKWVSKTKDSKISRHVARNLGLPTKEVFEGVLHVLCYVRNICAHHNRLWNRKLVKRLPNIKRFRNDIILEAQTDLSSSKNQPDNRMYNVLTIILIMINHQNTRTSYPNRLIELIETTSESQQIAMGFPKDWRTRPAWVLHDK